MARQKRETHFKPSKCEQKYGGINTKGRKRARNVRETE